eukprot:Pgem_evm2s5200
MSEHWTMETFNVGKFNGEHQSYGDGSTKVVGGNLNITATRTGGDTWKSGRFITKGKKEFVNGYFETRTKMNEKFKGAFPAVWMLGSGQNGVGKEWPADGELDIMEYCSSWGDITPATVHTTYSNRFQDYPIHSFYQDPKTNTKAAHIEEWNVYGMEKREDLIRFFRNDVEIGRYYNPLPRDITDETEYWPFTKQNKVFFIVNLAVHPTWNNDVEQNKPDPNVNSMSMLVDY